MTARRFAPPWSVEEIAKWRSVGGGDSYGISSPFMLPTMDLTRAALRMRLGTLDLSTNNGRIIIDDPTMGAFSFVVPAADLSVVQPGHYRVELLVFQPGSVKKVFTGSIDVVMGETPPTQ